ncbi:type II toxin-antitoxin system CcdA family antitoxin [Aquidulcibacter sp.]|uniref:type II toxin-antitoxin system CcdA family antitoxin n=1 Tax=Aquidulcibacter sp. TaxID=2052990 RepID=UPI00345BAB18|nr:type II toxin-antitoxin system CcdA family antitoxin [Aquidulcibacter sp.]
MRSVEVDCPTPQEHKLADPDKDTLLQAWCEANKTGFEALNVMIESEGLPLEEYRLF